VKLKKYQNKMKAVDMMMPDVDEGEIEGEGYTVDENESTYSEWKEL